MSRKQVEQGSILSSEIKYVQYSQHPIGHHALKVKAPEERNDAKMYKKLQVAEIKSKEINFNSDPERLKVDYFDVFEEV